MAQRRKVLAGLTVRLYSGKLSSRLCAVALVFLIIPVSLG